MSTFLSKIMDSAQDVRVSDSNERLNEYIQGVLRKSDLESFVAVAPRRDGYRIYVGEDMENPFAYVDVYLDGESLVVEGSSKRHLSDAEMGDLARFLGINGKEAGEKLNRFRKFVDLLRSESGKSVDDLKDAKVSDSGNKSWPEEYREKLHAVPVPEKRGRLTEQEEQDIMDRRNGIAVSSVTQLLNSMGYDAKGEEMDITVRGNEKSAEIRVGGLHNSDGFLAINVEGGRTEYFDITDAESWISYLRTALGGFVKDSAEGGRYKVWVDSESEEELPDGFKEYYNDLNSAYNAAVDFVHEYDGKAFRVIAHVEDVKAEETVETVENQIDVECSDDDMLDMLSEDSSPKMLSRVANILKAQQRTSLKDGNTEVMAIAEYPNGALVYSFKQKAWQEAVKDSCKKVKDSDDESYKEELRTIYESYEDGSTITVKGEVTKIPDSMSEGGVSTTKSGEEKYEKFTTRVGRKSRTMYQYDYRTPDGELFSCVAPSLESCRAKRDAWLEKRGQKVQDDEYFRDAKGTTIMLEDRVRVLNPTTNNTDFIGDFGIVEGLDDDGYIHVQLDNIDRPLMFDSREVVVINRKVGDSETMRIFGKDYKKGDTLVDSDGVKARIMYRDGNDAVVLTEKDNKWYRLPIKDAMDPNEDKDENIHINWKISDMEKYLRKPASMRRGKKVEDSKELPRRDFVFPADSTMVNDGKGHFPLNSLSRGRAALAFVARYDKLPKWYSGDMSLEEFKDHVRSEVKKAYPSIEVSDSAESGSGSFDFNEVYHDLDVVLQKVRQCLVGKESESMTDAYWDITTVGSAISRAMRYLHEAARKQGQTTDYTNVKDDCKVYDAKESTEDMWARICEADEITEREIDLLNRRLNAEGRDTLDYNLRKNNYDLALTDEQERKALAWLNNQWKTSTGKERKNNPFGYREEQILDNATDVTFVEFYNAGNGYIDYFIPVYRVYSNDGSFEYYVQGGEVSIVG